MSLRWLTSQLTRVFCVIVVGLGAAKGVQADHIPTPYWESSYNIDDSYMWIESPVVGVISAR